MKKVIIAVAMAAATHAVRLHDAGVTATIHARGDR